MKKINSPSRYRIINGNFSANKRLTIITIVGIFFILIVFLSLKNNEHNEFNTVIASSNRDHYKKPEQFNIPKYNSTYPIHEPSRDGTKTTYNLLAIADLDTNSKITNKKYGSFLMNGKLTIDDDLKEASVQFNVEDEHLIEVSSQYAYGDRGMELSELITFNGNLYSCDDRTGIVYEMLIQGDGDKILAIPFVILVDGSGRTTGKGFKCEWMSVKGDKLYIGGLGKEWTTPKGEILNTDPQWIKIVGHIGDVNHLDWSVNYNKIRDAGGYSYPGYMIFESGVWCEEDERWYFLPRRVSAHMYDETLDERRGSNLMVITDFDTVLFRTIGEINPVRGYSSFKFVPNTNNRIIIALKSEEDSGTTKTYVTVFDQSSGFILIKDQIISNKYKFEGVEFY